MSRATLGFSVMIRALATGLFPPTHGAPREFPVGLPPGLFLGSLSGAKP